MAYQRTNTSSMYYSPILDTNFSPAKSTPATAVQTNVNISATALLNADDEDALSFKEKVVLETSSKPLVLFSIDISSCSPILKSIILIGGLIFFMCLYGYYQELVIYGLFDRKLSIFSTFLHFLGCSIIAQVQRQMSPGISHGTSTLNSITMGTATTRTSIAYYTLLVILKTASQGLSNLSMTEINYPAKVLFKSANPVITMCLGILWWGKTYPPSDYLVVALLLTGLYIFITSHDNASSIPNSSPLGVFYVLVSMVCGVSVPMLQEHVILHYSVSVTDLIYFSYVGSTLISLILSVLTGEMMEGVRFIYEKGDIHTTMIFVAFCTFGFAGANFSTSITAQYGSLVNGISNTFRKAVTIFMSFLMFPDRNVLTTRKIVGTVIFFSGLLVKIILRGEKNKESVVKQSQPSTNSSVSGWRFWQRKEGMKGSDHGSYDDIESGQPLRAVHHQQHTHGDHSADNSCSINHASSNGQLGHSSSGNGSGITMINGIVGINNNHNNHSNHSQHNGHSVSTTGGGGLEQRNTFIL